MTTATIPILVARHGGGTKFRRALLRANRWRDADWYRHWPEVAALLESALAERDGGVA